MGNCGNRNIFGVALAAARTGSLEPVEGYR
jgi:hypothetical protein